MGVLKFIFMLPDIFPFFSVFIAIKERGDFMEDFLKAAGNTGFPMVVAAYLLIRIESKLDKLPSSISELATIISVKLGTNNDHKAA